MDTIRICKQCRKPLPDNAPEGLCPECLARIALGSEPAAPGKRIPPEPAALGAQFPQLEIMELLGMGGMGMVYKARQPKLDRLVALKILPIAPMPDASFGERFEREAKALARLNHPGIVAVYDFGQTSEYYYFIMEFVDGMNLRQLIQAKNLQPRQALELVTQICTALQFAHDEQIVHRDIKPENILITKKGQVKIADFGLAKLLGSQPDTALTASQMVMGTLNYMAPEQRENTRDVDHRADIYSLGVVIYEMLTGQVPMGRFDPPSKKVQIDVRLDELVLHALEREPSRRYQHVSEVKTKVESISSTMPAATPVPPAAAVSAETIPKRFHSLIKFLVAFLVVAGVLCFLSAKDLTNSTRFELVLSVGVFSSSILFLYQRQQIEQARKKGLWPQWGEIPKLEHVKALMQAGETSLAIKLFRQIHPVSALDAKIAVEKLFPPASFSTPQPKPTSMPEAEKVFSRSDAISIAKFILAIFICYLVGCFVPFGGLLLFCAVLLVVARKLSAHGKKPSVPPAATPPPGFWPFALKRFAIAGGAWLAVGLCLHLVFGDAVMTVTFKGDVFTWSLGNWAVTFPPSEPVPLGYTLIGICASLFYLGFAGSVLSAIFILVTITWLEARARYGLTPRQLPPSIRSHHRFWVGATMAGFAVAALTTTFLFDTFDNARPFSMRDYQNASDQASEFWFVPNSGAYEKLGFKAEFADNQEPTNVHDPAALPACTLSIVLHRTNAEPVVMKVILPGLRASYRFPATNNWDNTFVLDKDSLAAWLRSVGGVDLSVPKLQAEADQVYELLKAYQIEPPVTVKEFVNLGKADLRDFYFGGMKGDSFSIGTVQSNGIFFVVICIESLIYLALHLWSTRRLFTEALAEIQSGRWSPQPATKLGPQNS